jgi:fatty-acyl-CoA synthase
MRAFAELEQSHGEVAFEPQALDDVINMQYTSGTTGFPKGVMLTHRNIVNNGCDLGDVLRYTPADRVCVPVPLFHCFGCVIGVLGCYTHGATMALVETFDPLVVLQTIHRERCTAVYGVPTMFLAEVEHPEFSRFDLTSLRTGVMAGALCPVSLMQRVMTTMHIPEMTIAYGLTEASPAITQTEVTQPLEKRLTTVGKALPGVEVKIADPSTLQEVPRGQQGELWARGYNIMKGYYRDPDATARAITPDGWLRSGDLATMDQDGYISITGRLKELIIRGGENISPKEIEEVLRTHPAVSDVAVYGVPDSYLGEDVAVAIRLKSGASAEIEEVRRFVGERLSRFKVPKHVEFVDAFPQTASGKIQKFRLREEFVSRKEAKAQR